MRQRLLLVAGWAAAAVLTSLVASGAVAVAGGQVLDRPLRPLSAAEVAALPVAAAEFVPQRTSPLPPAASLQNGNDTVDGASRNLEPGLGDVPSPVGDRGALGTDVLDASEENLGRSAPAEEPPPVDPVAARETSKSKVEHLIGGSVSVGAKDGQLRILWVVPRTGYTMDVHWEGERRVTIVFNGRTTSIFVAEATFDGDLITDASEKGV